MMASARGTDPSQQARDYIRRNYARDCRTSTLAARLGVTASTLCHRYREAFGVTIGRDVRSLRMRRARQLLREDPYRLIKNVAAEVGYAHATYRTFLNAFRAEAGMSPSSFANLARLERLASRLRRGALPEPAAPVPDRVAERRPTAARQAQSRIRSA